MTTPPAIPPPTPKLWSFIKEIFLNRSTLMGFLRRHKFATFLYLTNTTLFVVCMLLLELNFDNQNRVIALNSEKKMMEADLRRGVMVATEYEQCRNALATALAIGCERHPPRNPSTPRRTAKTGRDQKPSASNIADKLNAIRDRNS